MAAHRRSGPEMFTLPRRDRQVRVKYFAQDANRASTRTKVYATIYEGCGTPQELWSYTGLSIPRPNYSSPHLRDSRWRSAL